MTPNEFRVIVNAIELRNPPFRIELAVHDLTTDDTMCSLHVMLQIPDRETGRPTFITHATPVPFVHTRGIADIRTAWEWVFQCIGKAAVHEVRESFHFDGDRVLDPHADDPPGTPEYPPL